MTQTILVGYMEQAKFSKTEKKKKKIKEQTQAGGEREIPHFSQSDALL